MQQKEYGGNERAQRAISGKPNSTCLPVLLNAVGGGICWYCEGIAGMSEHSERLVGSQIYDLRKNNPAKGG